MKKVVIKLVACAMAFAVLAGSTASAYEFKNPDWKQLLDERKAMATESDFELYVEGSPNSAPYYGARLEPTDGAYLGMVAENSLDFGPLGAYLTYVQDMWQPDLYYPANDIIKNSNAVTMVGWTISDLNAVDYNVVRNVLNTLSSYNKPMFIRFANEMNSGVPIGNEPAQYIDVFRKVADMVHEYPNFAVVWSPSDVGGLNQPFELYYPGDEYVDWVGVSCYSITYFLGNKNTSVDDSFYFLTGDASWPTTRLKPILKFMADYNIQKPVMISEGGVAVDNIHGDYLDDWAAPRLRNMLYSVLMKYPQVKMINYFNVSRDENELFYISSHPYACDIFSKAKDSGAYKKSYGESAKFAYQRADAGADITANSEGVISLHTLAYVYGMPNLTVNYNIDGNWYTNSSEIPYTCNLYMNMLADGAHTLQVSTTGLEKSYTFYKRGNTIRFGGEPQTQAPPAVTAPPAATAPPVTTAPSGTTPADTAPGGAIKVVLNGTQLSFEQDPVLIEDRTLVPLRAISEALGATVRWQNDLQIINMTRGKDNITMQIDNNLMLVNITPKELDVPPRLINDFTMVPVRAISEAFNCEVSWDDATQTVYING